MSNMSYCRFHNTVLAVQDCMDALETYEDAPSSDEIRQKENLIEELDEQGYDTLNACDMEEYDCTEDWLNEHEEAAISSDERKKARELIQQAHEIVERFGDLEI